MNRLPRRARKGAADAGVLVEVEVAPPTQLPVEDERFDLAVVDDTAGLLGTMRAEDRVASIRELARVLRPGGRVMIIGAGAARRPRRAAHAHAERPAVRRVRRRDQSARSRGLHVGPDARRT